MNFSWQKSRPSFPELRAEFIACYLELAPGETVRSQGDDWIEWEGSDGATHKMMLGRVAQEVARLGASTLAQRRAIYSHFIRVLMGAERMPASYSLDQFRERIFPSIRRRAYLDHIREQTKSGAPHHELNDELIVSYVIDFPQTLAHITDKQAEELGIGDAELWPLARRNLETLFSREQFRAALAQNQVVHPVECPDGHASARLLLLGEWLEEGEELAALVPDGAQLLLVQAPPTNNWNSLRQYAKQSNSSGWDRPFRARKNELVLM